MRVTNICHLRDEPENAGFDYTYWVVVKDLKRGCMYYRGYFDMGIRWAYVFISMLNNNNKVTSTQKLFDST